MPRAQCTLRTGESVLTILEHLAQPNGEVPSEAVSFQPSRYANQMDLLLLLLICITYNVFHNEYFI